MKAGGYRYARHASTEVLIASYWLPELDRTQDEPLVWLPLSQPVPRDLLRVAADKEVLFFAHNAQFERAVWKWALRRQHPKLPDIAVGRWRCTAAMAAASGLARSLEPALQMLNVGQQKDPEGKRLIKVFCVPRKPTKANPRTRIYPKDEPEEFKKFILYCQRDVLGELTLHEHLPLLDPLEQKFYTLDMRMNERGLPIDLPLVRKASEILKVLEHRTNEEVLKLTGGIRATQRVKMLGVLGDMGVELDDMKAQTLRDEIANNEELSAGAKRLLLLRIESSKASTKKLISMLACTDPEEYIVQGGFLFHGAHTGRYAGRLVQPQNFIRGKLKLSQQSVVFDLLHNGDADLFQMLYEWPIDTISQCMRGFIRAPAGKRFVIVDYTAIEARVLAWIADERKVLRAYEAGVDVYKMMASKLFKVRIEDVDGEQRRLGKNLVLGCGYSLGGARFVEYCAGLGQVVEDKFAKRAVALYREEHPAIVQSWKNVEEAAVTAIRYPGSTTYAARCSFKKKGRWLCVGLPSGRELRYLDPKATPTERYGRPSHQISFLTDTHGHPHRETTYGGKLIENITQAIARDVMREGMFAAENAGYPVCGTVHDELFTLRDIGEGSHKELEQIVCDLPEWTRGIPLNAEGFECERYRKG